MPTSLPSYRAAILERALALLWRQWSLLGIPGHADSAPGEPQIIDPEALLLVTSELGRLDPRLFEEAIHWLRHFGKLINIQRLRSLHRTHSLGDPRALAAIASTLQENSRLAKWGTIESLAKANPGDEPFFLSPDGTGAPIFGEPDAHFAKFGFFRSHPAAGQKSSKASGEDALARNIAQHPELLLMKLRALFGVNARAEIIAALLAQPSTHPAVLARRIGYLPRSVQDTLNEMALSGLLACHRAAGSREKYFTLRPSDWFALLADPDKAFPKWTVWPVLFALLQDTLIALYSPKLKTASEMMLALRLREAFDRHYPALSEAGLAGRFMKSSQASGAEFIDALATDLGGI